MNYTQNDEIIQVSEEILVTGIDIASGGIPIIREKFLSLNILFNS